MSFQLYLPKEIDVISKDYKINQEKFRKTFDVFRRWDLQSREIAIFNLIRSVDWGNPAIRKKELGLKGKLSPNPPKGILKKIDGLNKLKEFKEKPVNPKYKKEVLSEFLKTELAKRMMETDPDIKAWMKKIKA